MLFPNLNIWIETLKFHLSNGLRILPLLPLLFFPVFSDHFHALIIRNYREKGELLLMKSIVEAIKSFPTLLGMKLYFELRASLWAFVPIYGIIKDVEYRIQWAMASNVLVFENISGDAGIERCKELAEQIPKTMSIRTLVTIPALILMACLILFAVLSAAYPNSLWFWLFIIVILWIVLPWSAAVNTYLYLRVFHMKAERDIHR